MKQCHSGTQFFNDNDMLEKEKKLRYSTRDIIVISY